VNWIPILVGVALLTVGRKLFWVFAGGAGFVAGMWLMQAFFPEQPQNTVLIAGAIGAVAGIALTKFVKTIAINIGGFLGGGVIGLGLARMIGPWLPEWSAFIVMGILGVVLLKMAFETALLLISSIAGAMLIAANLPLSDPLRVVAIVVLSIAGILIQRKVKEGGSTQKE
jgi:MFS family permease